MKTMSMNHETVEAGAFVVMQELHGWVRPLATFGTFDGASGAVRRLLEADAASITAGAQPGQSKWYVIPVEHTP